MTTEESCSAEYEPDWYNVECDDGDYSQFVQNLADAETLVLEHGGEITPLVSGPMPRTAKDLARICRTLCDLMRTLPVPRSKKARAPYQAALVLAAEVEGKVEFVPLEETKLERHTIQYLPTKKDWWMDELRSLGSGTDYVTGDQRRAVMIALHVLEGKTWNEETGEWEK